MWARKLVVQKICKTKFLGIKNKIIWKIASLKIICYYGNLCIFPIKIKINKLVNQIFFDDCIGLQYNCISNFNFIKVEITCFLFIKIIFLFILHIKNSFYISFYYIYIYIYINIYFFKKTSNIFFKSYFLKLQSLKLP